MAISFNTGTTATVANSTATGHTFTIPAGVLNGDTVYVLVMGFSTATGTISVTLTSSATTPVAVGGQQATGIQSGLQATSAVWSIAATGSDAGATLTFGATGGTGGSYWFNVGLVAYTGAGGTDVNGGNNEKSAGATVGTITTPSLTTTISGDWQIQMVAGGPPNGCNFNVPGGLTSREAITSSGNAGLLLNIADSNASVGGSGTAIGNTTWTTTTGSSGANVMTSFTIGMEPPGAAAVTPVPYLTQYSGMF